MGEAGGERAENALQNPLEEFTNVTTEGQPKTQALANQQRQDFRAFLGILSIISRGSSVKFQTTRPAKTEEMQRKITNLGPSGDRTQDLRLTRSAL